MSQFRFFVISVTRQSVEEPFTASVRVERLSGEYVSSFSFALKEEEVESFKACIGTVLA